MVFYSVVLFCHILGAVGFFTALAIERLSLFKLQRARNSDQAGEWLRALRLLPRIGIPATATLLLSGIYLTLKAWRAAPWIGPSFGALILIAIVGAVLSGPGMKKLQDIMANQNGSHDFSLRNPVWGRLWVSLQIRTGLALGILFVMSVKPGLTTSLLALTTALILSLSPVVYFARRYRRLNPTMACH